MGDIRLCRRTFFLVEFLPLCEKEACSTNRPSAPAPQSTGPLIRIMIGRRSGRRLACLLALPLNFVVVTASKAGSVKIEVSRHDHVR